MISLQGTTTVASTGALSVAASTLLGFDAGTTSLDDGTMFSGAGTVAVRGGTFTIPAGQSPPPRRSSLSGGTIDGAGTLTVDGALTWYGGTMSGTGTTIANGTMALGTSATAASSEQLVGQTLDNFGTATESYNPPRRRRGFPLGSGATFNNEAAPPSHSSPTSASRPATAAGRW